MRVLLVQLHLGRPTNHPPLFPLALCYLAMAIKDHEVRVTDMNLLDFDASLAALDRTAREFSPEATGLALRNLDTTMLHDPFLFYRTLGPTADLLRNASPQTPLILGGTGFSMFPNRLLELYPQIDLGLYKEAEDSLPALLDHLDAPQTVKGVYSRQNGSVVFSGEADQVDFAALPMPPRDPDGLDIRAYLRPGAFNIGLQSMRGCVMKCPYCNYPELSGRRLRLRAPVQVVDEIEYLGEFGVTNFSFVDNLFNLVPSHTEGICDEIARRGLDVRWSAWFEIKNATDGLLRRCAKAGCAHFGFSPDGGTDRTMDIMHKGIGVDDVDAVLRILRGIPGIMAGFGLFAMVPGSTWRDVLATFWLQLRIHLAAPGRFGAGMGFVRMYPDTELLRMAQAEGAIAPGVEMLPERAEDLAGLFYTPQRFWLLTWAFLGLTRLREWIKPHFHRLRRRRAARRDADQSRDQANASHPPC